MTVKNMLQIIRRIGPARDRDLLKNISVLDIR